MKPCTEDEILKLRAEWTSKMWLAPTADLDLTNNQLSVLKRLKEAGHNMLAFDMGVWAPMGGQRERRFMLTAHVRNTEGEWVAKEEPGAQNIEDWTTGWEFASVGFVMARIIEKGVADAKKAHFTRLANLYPQAWWIAYRAEWQLRHEWAVAEHRRQKAFYHEQPELSKDDPDMPWNTVLLAAIRGVESMQYWETDYKDQARLWMETRRTPTYSTPAQIINPPGTGKRSLKRRAAELRDATGPPVVRARTTENVQDERRADGRHYLDASGTELCFAWNRSVTGCAGICTSTPPRAHACEWCRAPHRAVACPTHPNWSPPPQEKRKGKGKGERTCQP